MTFATGLFISTATMALAEDPQTPAAQPAAPAATTPASEKLICKQDSHEGSIIHTNVCKTQAQWDNARRSQQRDVSDFQNRNYQMSNGGH
jgi:invasion protein IalB